MSFLRALLGLERLSGTARPSQWLVDWIHGGIETASGESVNERTALTCAAVKAAVSVLAETVASLPLDVYERLSNGGRKPAANHPCQRVIHDEFNPEMSSFIGRETMQGHLGTWGNGYAEIRRTIGGEAMGLLVRSPEPGRTKPVRGEDGRLFYECHDERGGREPNIRAEDMLHIPGFGFDGLVGYSPIGLAREAIGGNLAAQRFANELFKNSGAQEGFLTAPGKVSKEAYARLKAAKDSYAEHGNRHKMMILEEGLTWANRSMNPEDLQMVVQRRFGIEEIARFYRINPTLLGDLTRSTFANVTELGRQFIVYTMDPWLQRWQAEINRKLLKPPFFALFNIRAFMRGDHAARAAYYNTMSNIGAYTINDIRAWEDEDDIGPAGDVHFVPLNMVPLEIAIKGPQPKPEPVPPKPPAAEEKPATDKSEGMATEETPEWLTAREWLKETLTRLGKVEAMAVTRVSTGDPKKFMSRIEDFYSGFEATLAGAIERPCHIMGLLPGVVAEEHCTAVKFALLTASECQPEELAGRVAEYVGDWLNPEPVKIGA